LCARGEFLKSMDEKRAKEKFEDKKLPNKPEEIEKGIVENCTVEDVGGFLYAGNPPVKRSSAFQVSYALPIKKIAIYSTVEPQLHARHAQMPEVIQNKVKEGAAEQMIYYVETGTSIYGFILNLDLNAISKSALTGELIIPDYAVKSRRKAAVKALVRMLSSGQFGAKLSRFLPNGSIISLAVSITEKPFVVTSPIYDEFEDNTLRRLDKLSKEFNEKCAFYVMGKDEFKTPEDVLTEVVNYLKNNNII
ncbi:DevR family CRISPR-associated autoregulator, partial [Saccharolobus sp.]|uniref:DevR family CRISPR-associated autoregulator n=1 Tax=Saccharolobus sp. TaxID=2100761 RepID=UPI00317C76BA